jgi:hypothetical protein
MENVVENVLGKRCVCLSTNNKVTAFVVVDDDNSENYFQICVKKLPRHLVPGEFVPLRSLPMTSNGKVDKAKLLSLIETSTVKRKPESDLINLLQNLWEKYLSFLPQEDANFVELGGDSHLAVLFVQEFEDRSGKLPFEMFSTDFVTSKRSKIFTLISILRIQRLLSVFLPFWEHLIIEF